MGEFYLFRVNFILSLLKIMRSMCVESLMMMPGGLGATA